MDAVQIRVRALELAVDYAVKTFTGAAYAGLVTECAEAFEKFLNGPALVPVEIGE